MKNILSAFLFFFITAFALNTGVLQASWSKKANDPFVLEISAEKAEYTEVTLSFTPQLSPENVELSFILPENAVVVSGETTWSGMVEKDESKSITILLEDTDTKELFGSVKVDFGKGTILVKTVKLHSQISEKPVVEKRTAYSSKGEPLVEHRLTTGK